MVLSLLIKLLVTVHLSTVVSSVGYWLSQRLIYLLLIIEIFINNILEILSTIPVTAMYA